MSILEQDQINDLIAIQAKISEAKNLADSAISKILQIYEETTGKTMNLRPDILLIGACIRDIQTDIKPYSQYYDDYKRLKQSYIGRGHLI